MTQYYLTSKEDETKIQFVDEDLEKLKKTLLFLPDYTEKDIKKCKKNYVIDGFEMMTKAAYNTKKAEQTRAELINKVYEIKAAKAYGGVIINDTLKFETNQTAITNTVSSLALMSDTETAEWKYYTLEGEPSFQSTTKAQLTYIAKFGKDMMNECFKIESTANEALSAATEDDLLNADWIENFKTNVQTQMDNVVNTLTIQFEDSETET